MESIVPSENHCRLYAFFHEGKYYCFLDDGNVMDNQFGRDGIVRILEEGGQDLLDSLRTVFDFVETGVSSSDIGGKGSDFVRNNPNPEWEKAFATACLFFSQDCFPAFCNLELVDLGYDGMLNNSSIDKSADYLCAIDLDSDLFHECGRTFETKYLVVSHPIAGLTIERLEKLHNQNGVEGGFWSQSFPLPHQYKNALKNELSLQGYVFCHEMTNSYAPMLWRVKEKSTGRDLGLQIFLPPIYREPLCTPFHERHMIVAELLISNPHPNLIRVWKRLTLCGNPALVIDPYDSDLQSAKEKLSRQQINCIIEQVVRGIIYLHNHGLVHHEIKPSNILIKYNSEETPETREDIDGSDQKIVKAVIHDFQSISIPSARYQNGKQLRWVDSSANRQSTNNRWLSGWAPMKKCRRFLRPDFDTANPWTIDCSSVAIMFLLNNIEMYQAYKQSSVSDYRDHPEFSLFFNVVNLFQSHARSATDVVAELEATIRTLSSMDIINHEH